MKLKQAIPIGLFVLALLLSPLLSGCDWGTGPLPTPTALTENKPPRKTTPTSTRTYTPTKTSTATPTDTQTRVPTAALTAIVTGVPTAEGTIEPPIPTELPTIEATK